MALHHIGVVAVLPWIATTANPELLWDNGIVADSHRAPPDTAKAVLAAFEQQASELTTAADRIRRALITLEED